MSEQLDIFDVPFLEFAQARASYFRDGFLPWLAENRHVWRRFEREADAIYRRGRRHYSARTILEYLRHDTALREEGEWKLNNNRAPDMARLYLLMHPERDGFFELRANEGRPLEARA